MSTEGGKLNGAVKDVMEAHDVLAKTKATAAAVRAAGGKVFHSPIMYALSNAAPADLPLGTHSTEDRAFDCAWIGSRLMPATTRTRGRVSSRAAPRTRSS